jgi:hypothetical protein
MRTVFVFFLAAALAVAFQAAQAAAARRNTDATSAGTKVRSRCDAEGGLHLQVPQGSTVERREGESEDAEAEITLPEQRGTTMIRTTRSLGFIGDGKLTQIPSRGGPWNVPDGLLPIHHHGLPDSFMDYGTSGYANDDGYGYGASSGYVVR